MAGFAHGLSALNVGVIAFVLVTGLAIYSLGTERNVEHAAMTIRLQPGKAASATSAQGLLQNSDGCNPQDAYTAAALRNLTNFQEKILTIGLSYFGVSHPDKGKNSALNLWQLLGPAVSCPPDRPLSRYGGGGDGSKLLCKLPEQEGGACVIYSMGSNGDYSFEQSVLKATSCTVYTFDCTYSGASQGPRHSYYKWCIGDPKNGPEYRSWANVTATLGHSKVDVLKIDIEGHEYKVFADFSSKDPTLPRQIATEFHVALPSQTGALTGAEVVLAYMHLGQLGYALTSQEVNVLAPYCCSEASFIKLL